MIGVFDSGFGGLSILKYFLRDLPEYNYIYLGDNARAPYGIRSQETIYKYTEQAVDFLFKQDCRLIIIACNTASSQALRKIQQEYLPAHYPDRRVLGVILPVVEEVSKNEKFKKVGVIGTRATIESGSYSRELKKINPKLEVLESAAPLLVPLIEEGWIKKPETKMILKKYLHPLKTKQVQALVLACTHYPFLLDEIRRVMTKKCQVYNPGKIIAKSLKDYLSRHPEMELKNSDKPQRQFFTTGDISRFKNQGEKFLGETIEKIEKVEL